MYTCNVELKLLQFIVRCTAFPDFQNVCVIASCDRFGCLWLCI